MRSASGAGSRPRRAGRTAPLFGKIDLQKIRRNWEDILQFIDVDETYRRDIKDIRNLQESRHSLDAAVTRLRRQGFPVTDETCARLSPIAYDHINFLGRYGLHPRRSRRRAAALPHRRPVLTARPPEQGAGPSAWEPSD
ncbi:Tn3 family transposase [Nonomuraea sp. NPDC050202]|uniref:Tn3 family transposase n=1 Tax=Nonomuraea sp. NPDC050202 TaxID=3155035 RepID=UPI0033C639D7